MNDAKSLEETLDLFAAGVDDVVRKPVHVREILARIKAIRGRVQAKAEGTVVGDMRVFYDGRDPEVAGEVLALPRRERRILEYLVNNKGCRVTKTQIFNYVYGLFSEDIDENVVESHISKLRKRLRHRLGYDPINSQRFLGYRLVYKLSALAYFFVLRFCRTPLHPNNSYRAQASFAQAGFALLAHLGA